MEIKKLLQNSREIWGNDKLSLSQIIVRMGKEQGITVMLSSHLLYQVQRICDKVGIIFKGKMVAQGSIEEIGERIFGGKSGIMKVQADSFNASLVDGLKTIKGVTDVGLSGETFIMRYEDQHRNDVIKEIVAKGLIPIEVRGKGYSLEEIYMRYFQEG